MTQIPKSRISPPKAVTNFHLRLLLCQAGVAVAAIFEFSKERDSCGMPPPVNRLESFEI
jgi:hypothetical protein